MNFRRASHKLRMLQRRHDQKERNEGYIIRTHPDWHPKKYLRSKTYITNRVTRYNQREYEDYHSNQRKQLSATINQLTLEPQK